MKSKWWNQVFDEKNRLLTIKFNIYVILLSILIDKLTNDFLF